MKRVTRTSVRSSIRSASACQMPQTQRNCKLDWGQHYILTVVFMMCLIPVSPQVNVLPQEVVQEHQDALLPCIYTRSDLPPQPSVQWTGPDERVLVKVNKGKEENRSSNVNIFLDQHQKGNFSLLIQKVSKAQSGRYECFIREVDFPYKVYLNVTNCCSFVKTEVSPTPPGGAAELHTSCSVLLLLLCVFNTLI